jgi:septal ring factor EnvC (AmiA/AmiB activator)
MSINSLHWEVVRLKKEVADLEEQLAQQRRAAAVEEIIAQMRQAAAGTIAN